MKNLLVVLSLVLFTSAASASSSNVKFVSLDNSVESNICIIAAENGYRAAKKQVEKTSNTYVFNITCNGQSLRSFSETFKYPAEKAIEKSVLVKPANNSIESQICVQAVQKGMKSVVNTTNYDVKEMVCNGLSITEFVKRYSNT